MQGTFMDLYRIGDVEEDDIDDYIDEWHRNSSIDIPIYTFLGLTRAQYDYWIETNELPNQENE